ncbi:MAG: hypothetical protein L3V56_10180, partial [Candidatus Magnetoovum sp. WYHC-5]|nr:hypothetical protein [Candidatus Magnetoovum sp. WYHC-5]
FGKSDKRPRTENIVEEGRGAMETETQDERKYGLKETAKKVAADSPRKPVQRAVSKVEKKPVHGVGGGFSGSLGEKLPPAKISSSDEEMEETSPHSSHDGTVLLTTNEVVNILNRGLEKKVTNIVSEDMITSVFKDAVNQYVNTSFDENFKNVTGFINDAIDSKLDNIIGQFNIESILNHIISSTINGLLTNLARDIFQITRDVIEDNIKFAVEDKIPTIQEEIGKIITEAVPEVAERMIRAEIDKLKADFD